MSGLTATGLTSCGFKPLHTPNLSSTPLGFANIDIIMNDGKTLEDQQAVFEVRQRLAERISVSSKGTQSLHILPEITRAGLGLTSTDIASRYDKKLNLNYQLKDTKTGVLLDEGQIRTVSSFGAPNDPYATISAEKNALRQISREAADQLLMRLARYYSQSSTQSGPSTP